MRARNAVFAAYESDSMFRGISLSFSVTRCSLNCSVTSHLRELTRRVRNVPDQGLPVASKAADKPKLRRRRWLTRRSQQSRVTRCEIGDTARQSQAPAGSQL